MKKKYTKENVALGFVENINSNYTIIITSNRRKHVPCFHIIDRKTQGQKFDCKIHLTEARYTKDTKNILNKKQKYDLIKILQTKEISIFGTMKNVWFNYLYCFKISNHCDNLSYDSMPDYSILKTRD